MPSPKWHALVRGVLCVFGLAASAFAVSMFVRGSVVAGLAGHILASVASGAVAAAAHGCKRSENTRRFLCAWVLSVGIPGAGPIGVLLVLVPIWARTRTLHDAAELVRDRCVSESETAFRTVDPTKESAPETIEPDDGFSGPPKRSHGRSQLERLLRRRSSSSRAAVRELQRALRQPEEEVRLLAHALLERQESAHRFAIEVAKRELEAAAKHFRTATYGTSATCELGCVGATHTVAAASRTNVRFQALRRLAFLHWTLVDRGLVPRELNAETLARASEYAREAFEFRSDSELCVLVCRIACRLRDSRSAQRWFELAVCSGTPERRLAQLHAELALVFRATPRG
jgi:hypothetical protein